MSPSLSAELVQDLPHLTLHVVGINEGAVAIGIDSRVQSRYGGLVKAMRVDKAHHAFGIVTEKAGDVAIGALDRGDDGSGVVVVRAISVGTVGSVAVVVVIVISVHR